MKNILVDSNMFCIFIFILIVSANFLAEIFPCKLQHLLRSNMLVKHIFGLFTMIFFVVLSSGIKNKNILNIAKSSFLLYILFILISKSQIYAFNFILIFLGITYIINIIKQEKEEKKNVNEELINEKINNYDYITYILYILIIITTIIGVILYMGEKKIEYRNNFNYITFFLGKPHCIGKSPKTNLFKALKYAFK